MMPMPRVKPTGVTEIELIVGAVTVRLVELLQRNPRQICAGVGDV